MFISEEESHRRLNDPRNVLTQVDRGGVSAPVPELPDSVLPALPDSTSPLETPEQEESSQSRDSSSELDPTLLLKMAQAIESGDARPGRKAAIRNRSIEENASIALTSILLGNGPTQEMFGTDASVQNALTHGFTGSGTRYGNAKQVKKAPKEELLDEIYNQGREVSNRAFKKLIKSLDLIDGPQGPSLHDIKDITKLTRVAKDLSGIIKDVTPKEGNLDSGGVHFHIYAPEQNAEEHYDTVEVNRDGSVSVAH